MLELLMMIFAYSMTTANLFVPLIAFLTRPNEPRRGPEPQTS